MATTKIEWADMTKQFVYGCTKCSPACDNCYAERRAAMLAMHPNHKISTKYACVTDGDGEWTDDIELGPLDFTKLIRARKPQRIFINSMSDTFHPGVPFDFLRKLWLGMKFARQHTFLILTKRHERMWSFLSDNQAEPLPNVWLGVTVCNQAEADAKIPVLLDTPAAKRFVSVEPMIGPVDMTHMDADAAGHRDWCWIDTLTGRHTDMGRPCPDVPKLDWVICGGETGPKARPMHPAWPRSLRDQCQEAGVPFFFKGWGEWRPLHQYAFDKGPRPPLLKRKPRSMLVDGFPVFREGKARAGRRLDGKEWNEVPE